MMKLNATGVRKLIKENRVAIGVDLRGWEILENEEQLRKLYPKPEYGKYRPQPYLEPDRYPCFYREEAFISNNNGPDEIVLAYLYIIEE